MCCMLNFIDRVLEWYCCVSALLSLLIPCMPHLGPKLRIQWEWLIVFHLTSYLSVIVIRATYIQSKQCIMGTVNWRFSWLVPLARHPTRDPSIRQCDDLCFYLCGYNHSIHHMQDHRPLCQTHPWEPTSHPKLSGRLNIYTHPLLIHSNEMLQDSFSG